MPASPEERPSLTRTTKVIAVADVVESVRLMEQDEQEFIRRWQRFVAFVRQRLPADEGRLHKSLGDGLMLEFSDPEGCIRSALAMRAWFAAANQGLTAEDQVQLRIGAHMAEFVADEHDIYGTDVNLAARIASLAGPGEIVISAALRDHLSPAVHARLEDLGTCHLKHVKEPVHAFRIGPAGPAPVLPMRRLAGHTLRPTLAVLPFGLHADVAAGGAALADDVVAALSRSDQLQVASRLATAPFAVGSATLDELRRVVGAHYVLTGRAHRQDGDLVLFVELADAVSGHVAWARGFQGRLQPAGARETQPMREIVAAVHSAVVAREVERSRAQPLHALEGFTLLLASIGLMHWLSAADTARARGMLEHLTERAPGHDAPHAWLAHLHVLALRQGSASAVATHAEPARRSAADALQCDPGSPLALSMLGQVCLHADGDAEAAQEHYARALAVRPDDCLALLLQAELRALLGDGAAATADLRRACEGFPLEALRSLYDSVCALAALVSGNAQDGVAFAQRALERSPHYLPALRTLIASQVLAGQLPAATRLAQRWARRHPGASIGDGLEGWPACDRVAQLFHDALRAAAARPD